MSALRTAIRRMSQEGDVQWTDPREFVSFLESTLIPDLYESGYEFTAGDFETLADLIKHGDRDEEFENYLRKTLIPDLKESGREFTAADFETGLRFLQGPGGDDDSADMAEMRQTFQEEPRKPPIRKTLGRIRHVLRLSAQMGGPPNRRTQPPGTFEWESPSDEFDQYDPAIDAAMRVFNDNDSRRMSVAFDDEYLTLYLDGKPLTQGEVEVLQRVKDINREHGYY